MLLTEKEYKNTMTSEFVDCTHSAENFNSKEFDEYVNGNLIEMLGKMNIDLIYETKDGKFRHIIFNTQLHNVHYIVIINLTEKTILGHYVLDLNKEYSINTD